MSTFLERKSFLSDLGYIFEQATAFHRYYTTGANARLDGHEMARVVHNALLESSLSFLRKVNEFFGGNREVSASDYLPSKRDNWLFNKDDSKLLNDRVMHLSLNEARSGKIDWGAFLKRNLPEALLRYKAFLDQLKQEQPQYFSA